MSTRYRRTIFASMPSFGTNTVIKLIIACGVAFVMFHFLRVTMLIMGYSADVFIQNVQANLALPDRADFGKKFWTVFTYGWLHIGFWQMVSNMLWLYCFGSLVQMLVGRKQVLPLFIYGIVAGGLFYLLAQLFPSRAFQGVGMFMGPQGGIVALAAAALTITPGYRFYLTPTFSLPLYVVAIIFTVLMVMAVAGIPSLLFLLLGGGVVGFGYIKLLKNGYRPGEWAYDLYERAERTVTPDEQAIREKKEKKRREELQKKFEQKISAQRRIDDILDKINQKGYDSLTAEEKEILLRASKDEN